VYTKLPTLAGEGNRKMSPQYHVYGIDTLVATGPGVNPSQTHTDAMNT